MSRPFPSLVLGMVILGTASLGHADEQQIAPGTGLQSAIVIDTGANGICETTAAAGDIQAATVGQGTPFQKEIRCGTDKVADTFAQGDDVQLVAVGAPCRNANVGVVDTGPNGVADTTADANDVQIIPVGTAPANRACVITGGNGVADTAAALGDDTLQLTPVGTAEANSDVILCGPNLVADTHANNVNPGGDDVQLVPVGSACANANTVVVSSGPNGIADTRAEGPDLVLNVAKPVRLTIGRGQASASRLVKLAVSNAEFGPSAPATRAYKLSVTTGDCPGGTVSQIDTDLGTPGLQATSNVPLGGRLKGSLVVTVKLQDITSVSKSAPFRCGIDVTAVALDSAPDADDAAAVENNSTRVDIEVTDNNDL